MLIKHIDKFELINLEGNTFGQGLNDCATLKNRHKRVVTGLEMVDPNLKCNLVTCLGMTRIKDGADEDGHDTLFKIFVERVRLKHNEIAHTTTSDRAAKVVATMFNHNEDVCNMHDCDKIGRSAIVYLIRTWNKVHLFNLCNISTLLHIDSVP